MDNTVETMDNGIVQDDAVLMPVQETEETTAQPLADFEDEAPQETPPAKEPGWIKGRIEKAVNKALKEQEDRLRAEFDSVLNPIRESVLERQAEDLVAEGEFKSKERALEYLKLKGGMPYVESTENAGQTQKPLRNAQGQFVSSQQQEVDPRAQILANQAAKIKAKSGVDVMAVFNNDGNIRTQVLSGQMDFYDVLESVQDRRSMPSPTRSSNGANVGSVSIANMSDAQFKKLQENLAKGIVYDAR